MISPVFVRTYDLMLHPTTAEEYNDIEVSVATVIKAIYEDGVFKPEEPVSLEEKTRVELVIQTPAPADDPTGWKAMREFIGLAGEGGSSGTASVDHDAILYRR